MPFSTARKGLLTYLTARWLKRALYSAAIVAAMIVLFIIDISEPRGVVDGVGYAAVVSLSG